jgi:tetratricopeptide (TPR) repeat protein
MKTSRKVAFGCIVWLIFFLALEGALKVLGVEARIDREDPYVGFASHIPLFVEATDDSGERIWHTADNKRRFFNYQSFSATKKSGTRRVFCLGGSTTYGRPYSDATSFCGWLRAFLPEGTGGAPWEVINAGGISYASYRVAALAQELARQQPDYFIVYTGHNEFLEERTYAELRDRNPALKRMDSLLRSTRIDAALRGVLKSDPDPAQPVLQAEVSAVLDGSVGPSAYERDDLLRDRVLEHYRFNLERIIRIARRAGAEPLLIVPASNLRGCSPFRSTPSLPDNDPDRAAWRDSMQTARAALEAGDSLGAQRAFSQAVALDPRHAESQYGLGQSLLSLGDGSGAEAHLRRARDEDVCPLRALSPMAKIVREVADREQVPVVDFEAVLEARVMSEQGHRATGEDWFLDHVHPTIEGHRILALEILDAMSRAGWVDFQASGWAQRESDITEQVMDRIDRRAHGIALRNLAKVLSWAGKSDDAARLAHKAADYLEGDSNLDFILGAHAAEAGDLEQALAHYRRALAHDPDYLKARNNLGTTLASLGRDAEAVDAYVRVLEGDPLHSGARFNLANSLRRLGRLEEAIAGYREVLQEDPEDSDARFNLALSYRETHAPGLAAAEFRKVLRTDPDDAAARRALEEIENERGDSS